MNLRDLLLGIDGVGKVSIGGNTRRQDGDENGGSDIYNEEDEEYTNKNNNYRNNNNNTRSSNSFVQLEYSENQKPIEKLRLSCMMEDLPLPSKKQTCETIADKRYPCRYCGEKFTTNYMLGNHVSRKHRHLSKIFKPQKPAKVIGQGQSARKRGRPRKYPAALDSQTSNTTNINNNGSSHGNYNYSNNNTNYNDNTIYNNNVNSNSTHSFHAIVMHPDSKNINNTNNNVNYTNHVASVEVKGRTERDNIMNKNISRLVDILHELENTPSENRVGIFERAPLFTGKLVALRALKQACDMQLISISQFLGKQDEFLLSFAF